LRTLGRWKRGRTSTLRRLIKLKENVAFDDGLTKRDLVADMEFARTYNQIQVK
jgi:hypothetical protein